MVCRKTRQAGPGPTTRTGLPQSLMSLSTCADACEPPMTGGLQEADLGALPEADCNGEETSPKEGPPTIWSDCRCQVVKHPPIVRSRYAEGRANRGRALKSVHMREDEPTLNRY